MSQPYNPAYSKSPSRRGTPSTSEPIPYFNNTGATSATGADFYSMISPPSAGAYQQESTGTQQRQPPFHPAANHTHYQQTSGIQHLPHGVPPRCATGPAVESPYQNYTYSASNPYPAAPGLDPYRSASVVYGGTYSGSQQAYQQVPATAAPAFGAPSDAGFFDQFSGATNATGQLPASGGYAVSDQYATSAAYNSLVHPVDSATSAVQSTTVGQPAEDSAANGVVFDEASGQYYDMNSGQYYDEASGAWYYPEQQRNLVDTVPDTLTGPIHATAPAQKIASPEPVAGLDGAAFFDNINAEATPSAFPDTSEPPASSAAPTMYPEQSTESISAELQQPSTRPEAPADALTTSLRSDEVAATRLSSLHVSPSAIADTELLNTPALALPADEEPPICAVDQSRGVLTEHQPAVGAVASPPSLLQATAPRSDFYSSEGAAEIPHAITDDNATAWRAQPAGAAPEPIQAHELSRSTNAPALTPADAMTVVSDTSLFYGQSHDTSQTPVAEAAIATVGYESLDSQPTIDGHGAVEMHAANYELHNEDMATQIQYSGAYSQTQTFVDDTNYSLEQAYADNPRAADSYLEYSGINPSSQEHAESGYQPGEALIEQAVAYSQEPGDSAYANGYAEYHEATAATVGTSLYSTTPIEASAAPVVPSGMVQDSPFTYPEGGDTEQPYDEREASVAEHNVVDPLGRLGARRPIVAFGFGGRLVTMFPRQVQRFNDYGGGGALKIAPGMLEVQQLSGFIPPEHGAQSSPSAASAPLLTGDTSRAVLAKRRDIAIACATALLGEPTFGGALSPAERALYGVVIAVLRAADQPEFQKRSLDEAIEAIRPLFGERQPLSEGEDVPEQLTPIVHGAATDLRGIEDFLLSGKRVEAIELARQRGMWAHALIIASCTGKAEWQAAVATYTEHVLGNDFATLGAQYRLFAGLGGEAFTNPQMPANNNFVTAAEISSVESPQAQHEQSRDSSDRSAVGDWARKLALALANRTPGDQAAILALGDRLKERSQVLAAHICYVLTLQNRDIFHGSADTGLRAVMLGVDEISRSSADNAPFAMTQASWSRFYRKQPSVFLTELYELAYVLRAAASSDSSGSSSDPSKKPTALLCLPHLQAYKLHHAWWLVDCGQLVLASQYCDALLGILASLPQGAAVPFVHAPLVQGLRDLRERLSGAGMTSTRAAEAVGDDAALAGASPKSWLARAVPRPSFTSLMTAFDSSIDKFITGADGSRIPLEQSATPGRHEVGPSRHTPLAAPAVPYASPRSSIDARPSATSTPAAASAEPPRMYTPTTFGSSADYAYGSSHATPPPLQPPTLLQPLSQPAAPQWGDPGAVANGALQGDFMIPGMVDLAAGTGYPAPAVADAPASSQHYSPAYQPPAPGADDDEDMFGFERKKTPMQPRPGSARPSADAARSTPASARPSSDGRDTRARSNSQSDSKEASGVFGMLKSIWGGRKNQANLGEESHFVFDPVQQRWVDKNAPSDQQVTAPPPPPPPSAMKFRPHSPVAAGNAYGSAPPPPGNGQPAPDMANGTHLLSTMTPPVPSAGSSRAATPMAATSDVAAATAPGTMPRAGAAKRRGARSRYVDVLNK
ncbi:hypothetical protein IWW52_001082 [Coemansia sp. RSA 2704]|nr:hypothetical protein IWW52_001082 [Coemansia sp. RSA 2704]